MTCELATFYLGDSDWNKTIIISSLEVSGISDFLTNKYILLKFLFIFIENCYVTFIK